VIIKATTVTRYISNISRFGFNGDVNYTDSRNSNKCQHVFGISCFQGHSAKNDRSTEVLRSFCTRETFLRGVPGYESVQYQNMLYIYIIFTVQNFLDRAKAIIPIDHINVFVHIDRTNDTLKGKLFHILSKAVMSWKGRRVIFITKWALPGFGRMCVDANTLTTTFPQLIRYISMSLSISLCIVYG
jgi:hypothetical protein